MPKDFLDCVKNKGRIRTIKPTLNTYIRICYDNKGSHSGEIRHNKVKVTSKYYRCRSKCISGKPCKNKTNKKYCWRHQK